MRRIAAAPLLHFFNGGKSGEKNAFYRSDAAKAKRSLHTIRFAPRLQLSLGVRTIRHEKTLYRSLKAKLGKPLYRSLRERINLLINGSAVNDTMFDKLFPKVNSDVPQPTSDLAPT